MEQYNVAVIGGGPGGYVAAIRAAQLKKKVVLIEKEHLGGVCLNWGCIPTKSLLKSAEVFEYIRHAQDYGIDSKGAEINIKKIVKRSREISGKLAGGVKLLLKKNKVTVIDGVASLAGNKIINIGGQGDTLSIKAENIIIATGARPRILKGFEPDGKQILTSKEAMIPQHVPKSIIIVGSGAIGIEFASFYNSIGVDVTVIEAHTKILPAEDTEIASIAHKRFEKKGIKIITNAKLIKQTKLQDKIEVELELGRKIQKLQAEILLMAVGITANTENLGLEKTKVKVENGYIVTNVLMQTAESGIYAIGDVAGAPCLAHKASHEGIIVAESIAGLKPHAINKHNIPSCTYSSPQIASLGLTEEAAKALGYELKIGRFPFMANSKALVSGDSDGLIKTIFDAKTGELLGAHMIGSDVTELIQGYVISKNLEGTELDLINTIFPHPTLSEMMHESVLVAYDRAMHI
ncbi:dihydrolipoamide dehydrogenase [Rickettsia canadensis str. McKiel]|uniref:Dihydrolipoyl dehydrogenase n=1 Tax=Rickettsia canadensis (strain McKiel) TaxID=293613 RepID=A8F008_RICCK|nr:dihydrolipoyl dehydrogenase [Rickettsia canadensis]ABV73941.1 dihydrolipoamide dehydrogenase [Rickettsia canadensis str. McKiel]